MPKYNQIYSLLNDVNKQYWGEDALEVHDLSDLVALGNALSINSNTRDGYLNKLVDRIGKTRIRTLDYELKFPKLFMDEFEYGCIMQKINVGLLDSTIASEFTVGDDNFTNQYDTIHKPTRISVSYFEKSSVFKFIVTIPDECFYSAFTSEAKMSEFITSITDQLSDSMTVAIDNLARTAVNNLIAEKILAGNGVINLVPMYNNAYGNTVAGGTWKNKAACEVDKEFYRWSSTVIRNTIEYLSEISSLYNVGDTDGNPIERATARDNLHVLMLGDFASKFDAYLLSDSFRDVFNMPLFTRVNYWQANKDSNGNINTFDVVSSVDVVPASQGNITPSTDRYEVKQDGVVCVLADREAVFVGLNRRRAGSFTNTIDGYTNLSMTALKGYCNDLSENAIIICMSDEIVTPAITLDDDALTFANSSAADQTLTATTIPADATVTWKSSKTSVATVAAGVVSAAGAGDCTITAEITVGGKKYTATCSVTVGS